MLEGLIGPFPGHITSTSVKLWVRLPEPLKGKRISYDLNPECVAETCDSPQNIYYEDHNLAVHTLIGLAPGIKYTAKLKIEGTEVPNDCAAGFTTLPESESGEWSFVAMSCHNPILYDEEHKGRGWDVWKSMPGIFLSSDSQIPNVRFALLGGDQVYADQFPYRLLQAKTNDYARAVYNWIYSKFWENEDYQSVMRRIPSYLMWDDHDIYDGWGSFKRKWFGMSYYNWDIIFDEAKNAFAEFQASRNPSPLDPADNFSFAFKHDRVGFLMLDLRSNRKMERLGGEEPVIWTTRQRERIFSFIDNETHDIDALIVLSPVTFYDLSKKTEGLAIAALRLLNFMKGALQALTPWKWISARLKKDPAADLLDDLFDGWSSHVNRGQLILLLDRLFAWQNSTVMADGRRRKVLLLSGDIHVGALTEIISSKAEHKENPVIEQITTSPVAYKPRSEFQNWALEGARNAAEIGNGYWAHHKKFFVDRNFATITVNPNDLAGRTFTVRFHLEEGRATYQINVPFPSARDD